MYTRPSQRGAALILSLTITVVSLIIIVGIVQIVIPFLQASSFLTASNQAYFAAEGAIENALYDISEHRQGYESIGPNGGTVHMAEYDEKADSLVYIPTAQASTLLSPNADDLNFRTPSASCVVSDRPLVDPTTERRDCAFYNNDPLTYDFGTCCSGVNRSKYKDYCFDAVKKFQLDSPTRLTPGLFGQYAAPGLRLPDSDAKTCQPLRTQDGAAEYSDQCIDQLISYADIVQSNTSVIRTCDPDRTQDVVGVPVQSGYSVKSIVSRIPLEGEGNAPGYEENSGALEATYNWNRITPDQPILFMLAFENNSAYGNPPKEDNIISPFGSLVSGCSSPATSSRFNLFVRIPKLSTQWDYAYDPNSQFVSGVNGSFTPDKSTASLGNNDVILRWQVSGFAKTSSGVDYTQPLTLYGTNSTANGAVFTDIRESDINRYATESNFSVLSSNTTGSADLTTQRFIASSYPSMSSCSTTLAISQFISLVHNPVLRISMVNNPPIYSSGSRTGSTTGDFLRPPFLEYFITTNGSFDGIGFVPMANEYTTIQAIGQSSRTQSRQFTQGVETKIRNDVAAPVLDYTIFQ